MPSKIPTAGIFIPTMNRVDFVIRQLRYYAALSCPHTIYVGDSSPKEESQKIEEEIKRLDGKIKAVYKYMPGYNDWEAHYQLITMVKEEYICYSGDDDYQIPNSITKCIEFLETHPDYTSASGHAVSFRLKEGTLNGALERLGDYPRQEIEDKTAKERILKFFNNYYVTHFSVNRTNLLKAHWKISGDIPDRSFRSEITPTSLPLVYGKSKIIDCLGFVRQIHKNHYNLSNMYDWVTHDDWLPSYKTFEKILAETVSQKDKISFDKACVTIRTGFRSHLYKQFAKEYAQISLASVNKKPPVKLRTVFSTKFPILKRMYHKIFKSTVSKKNHIHYDVLQFDSKYYDDFKPVMDSFSGNTDGQA